MKTMEKSYEDLMKLKAWQLTAEVLTGNISARKDDRILLKEFYKKGYGLTLDEAFENPDVPRFHSVCRMARRLKAVNCSLRYEKDQDEFKQIGLDIPVAVQII